MADYRFQHRRTTNPAATEVLLEGEWGVELDGTGAIVGAKLGDGVSTYAALDYVARSDWEGRVAALESESGTYRPASESIWLPGTDLYNTASAAVDVALGNPAIRHPAMQFDGTTEESAVCTFRVPTGWTSLDVDVVWANSGEGTGGVRWHVNYQRYGAGTTIGVETSGVGATGTAGAKNVVVVTRASSALTVVAGEIVWIELSRQPSNAGDTLANDAGVLGLTLGKA